jgi:hypothetical protein
VRRTWFSGRAFACHLTLAILLAAFSELFFWQVRRATSGNELSWVYVIEWPIFGAYAVYMWWRLIHEPSAVTRPEAPAGSPGGPETGSPEADASPAPQEHDDEELAAYNRYLAELHESAPPKRW